MTKQELSKAIREGRGYYYQEAECLAEPIDNPTDVCNMIDLDLSGEPEEVSKQEAYERGFDFADWAINSDTLVILDDILFIIQ